MPDSVLVTCGMDSRKMKIQVMESSKDNFFFHEGVFYNNSDIVVRPLPEDADSRSAVLAQIDHFCKKDSSMKKWKHRYEAVVFDNFCLIKMDPLGSILEESSINNESGVLSFECALFCYIDMFSNTITNNSLKVSVLNLAQLSNSQSEILIEENCEKNDLIFILNDNGLYKRMCLYSKTVNGLQQISSHEVRFPPFLEIRLCKGAQPFCQMELVNCLEELLSIINEYQCFVLFSPT